MQQLRSDLWIGGFTRRYNALGAICVIARRGDPIAGQIWIDIDHLDGTRSLLVPAPSAMLGEVPPERVFMWRYRREKPETVIARIRREAEFDPDFWVVALETREPVSGIEIVPS